MRAQHVRAQHGPGKIHAQAREAGGLRLFEEGADEAALVRAWAVKPCALDVPNTNSGCNYTDEFSRRLLQYWGPQFKQQDSNRNT